VPFPFFPWKKQTPHLIFKQYEWERKRGQGGPLSLSLLFLTRGPSSCCHQIPSSIFTSTTRLRNFLAFFFLYSKSLFDIFFINVILLLPYSHWILDQFIGYWAGLNLIIMVHRHTTSTCTKTIRFNLFAEK